MTAPIQFDLTAKKDATPIAFNLNKVHKFLVKLYWESQHDVDVHAILMKNLSHENDYQRMLTTYNPQLVLVDNPSVNHTPGGKKPFRNLSGSLTHMGDARTGIQVTETNPDEILMFDTSAVRDGENSVAFFVGIHPPSHHKFKEIKNLRIVVCEENGKELLQANVGSDFNNYDMAQVGGFVKNTAGEWLFDPSSMGLDGDFNAVVAATYTA